MKRVLVTGASGFVGSVLCEALARSGFTVRAALRTARTVPDSAERVVVGDICRSTNWTTALDGVDFVIHTAARTHVLNDPRRNSALYFETNLAGTDRLVGSAALAGVRSFVFLSSVKVNGELTVDRAFTATDLPRPEDAYAESKRAAEIAVADIGRRSSMQTVVVRSPLVYGPRVRANFLRLLRSVDREWLLPLGGIKNSRSLVSVWNLCDLLVKVLENPVAAGRTWMVSDGHDVSTPDLIRQLSIPMGRRARLVSVPSGWLRFFGSITGRASEVARLCGSLQVDIGATRRDLGWEPPVPFDEGLARTVAWYRSAHDARMGGSA